VRFIPLAERRGINLNDSTFDKCVGSNELVIGGVVYLNLKIEMGKRLTKTRKRRSYHTDKSCLASNML
jgi:hypothetical protein